MAGLLDLATFEDFDSFDFVANSANEHDKALFAHGMFFSKGSRAEAFENGGGVDRLSNKCIPY